MHDKSPVPSQFTHKQAKLKEDVITRHGLGLSSRIQLIVGREYKNSEVVLRDSVPKSFKGCISKPKDCALIPDDSLKVISKESLQFIGYS
jgi:hypothetical protein